MNLTAQPSPAAGLAEGQRRRDKAMDLFRLYRPVLVRRVQRAFLLYLLHNGPSTTDPVRVLIPLPAGIDPRLVGAAVLGLASLRLIRKVCLAKSVRPEAHGRDLPVWDIADCTAATGWLALNPDLPDLTTDRPACPDQPIRFG